MSWSQFLPAAVRYLRNDVEFMAAVDGDLGKDAKVTDAYNKGWIFQGLTYDGAPYRKIEGSSRAAIVLSDRSQWGHSAYHTNRFPELQVMIYADSTRNSAGNPIGYDAEARVKRVFEAVDAKFHDPSNLRHDWDGFYVHSSVLSSGPSISEVYGGDSTVRLVCSYEVSID